MSTSIKIVSSVVAGVAIWLGSTGYVSENTQSYLERYVERSNALSAQNGVQIKIESFEKGFFSSEAKMKVDFVDPAMRDFLSEVIKLPMNVAYEVENGPLFFKNGLGIGSSRIRSDIKLSEHVVDQEAFKKMFTNDVIINSTTTMDFFKNASFDVKSNNLLLDLEGSKVKVAPIVLTGKMNVKTFEGKINMSIASIVADSQTEMFDAKNVHLDADIKKIYDNGFYLGDFFFSAERLNMKTEELPFSLQNAKVSTSMSIDESKNKTIDMKFKLNADAGDSKLPMEYESLQKVELNYALNGTKLKGLLAFQDFGKELQQRQQELLAKLTAPKDGEFDQNALVELEKFQEESQNEMMLATAQLLESNNTNFQVNMKMTDKKAKESNLKFNLTYVGETPLPTTIEALNEKFQKELLSLFSLDLNIDLSKEYIANLSPQFQEELAGQLQMGAMFGVIHETNSSFSFDVNYKAKTLMVNGENRSEMLPMLEMGLGARE